jgi:3-hydroxyacyl-CoA dehydrogenase/enoyl-CoA hydratase/3-hydroxybutyryl-CoA epimerase
MDSPRLELDGDRLAWILFDDPDRAVNLLTPATVAQLDSIIGQLQREPPRGIIFISAKPGVFIAGADIKELEKIDSVARGIELSRAGHRLFNRIEEFAVPTVAAIDGVCLGGGCELALACGARVATETPRTQIGLPETRLGIIPGWGGTQRLPRLIGLRAALDIIVPGTSLDAKRALRIGLVDALAVPVALRELARAFALGRRKPSRASVFFKNTWPVRPIVCRLARNQARESTRSHYPAPLGAIEAVEEGLIRGMREEGLELEARIFGQLAVTPQCKNLIRVFFLREKYSKLRLPGADKAPPIRKLGVIGAGVMGAGIAQYCSARGMTVRLKDIKPEFVAAGMQRIAEVYREGVRRRKLTERDAQQGLARVHPTTDDTGFGDCDLVIEAVVEKLEVKQQVFAALKPLLRKDCLLASNTSAIPIDDLADASGRAERFVGIHFFNPVHKMPLVEVVRGGKTSAATLAAAVEFVKALKKIPVVARGTPGFLVNRLLMPYLNEAGALLAEGVGVTAIDHAMLQFGMPMGPLRLIDEVGIDVAVDVAGELAAAFPDRMKVAPILSELHATGWKGRKGGRGFYLYDGKNQTVNPDLARHITTAQRELPPHEIQRRLLTVMINEARRCLNDRVVEQEDDIDAAMIFGTGFPPFRGGLVRHARDTGLWNP